MRSAGITATRETTRVGTAASSTRARRANNREGSGVVAWIAALVIALSPHHSLVRHPHSRFTPDYAAAERVTRRVFGSRWRAAMCIARYESGYELAATNGVNLGPWQINVPAHPWVHPWLLTHSWRYSARVAYRISDGGRNWTAWTTAYHCGG